MIHTSDISPVFLVGLVYSVSLVQPNKQDKPNKPIKREVSYGGVLVDGAARVRDRTDQR